MNIRNGRTLIMSVALALLSAAATAHDSWFEPRGTDGLALGTGNVYPLFESAIDPIYLQQAQCAVANRRVPLKPLALEAAALPMSVPAGAGSCWAQVAPFEITLEPDQIAVYLAEVRPSAALLDAWQGMKARGLPWRERYAKHARIVFNAASGTRPSGMAVDGLLETRAGAAPQVGQPLALQVLRDGAPLPEQPVEMRNENTRFGIWLRTDANGRVAFTPLLAGRWVMRTIDLRVSSTAPDTFDSRFLTVAFAVNPP